MRTKPSLQSGQAIVEYAIILILTIILAVGGSELAATAYASSKISEAAKAAVNEYSEVIANVGVTPNIEAQQRRIDDLELELNAIEASPENTEEYLPTIVDMDADEDIDIDDYELALDALGLDTNADDVTTIEEVQAAADPIVKIKGFILLAKIAILEESSTIPALGDHNNIAGLPSCGESAGVYTYDYGFGDDRYVKPDRYPTQASAGENNEIYLFNPLPIDLNSCLGTDPTRGDLSRLSILVNGYIANVSDDPDTVEDERALNEPGLPELNRTMFSQYTKVCLNLAGEYAGCNSANAALVYMKPPGKLCLSNTYNPNIDSCSIDNTLIDNAGYYFWGQSNYVATPTFSPTFQLLCNGAPHESPNVMGGDCTNLETIEVNVRYRSVFESFLAFGIKELPNPANLQFFYNPNQVGVPGSNQLVGTVGSEIGPLGSTQIPTVKYFRDFRGCYNLNVDTGKANSCN